MGALPRRHEGNRQGAEGRSPESVWEALAKKEKAGGPQGLTGLLPAPLALRFLLS
jgi:hypothetical protein